MRYLITFTYADTMTLSCEFDANKYGRDEAIFMATHWLVNNVKLPDGWDLSHVRKIKKKERKK